jgi:lipopolysaccharide export system permease protein
MSTMVSSTLSRYFGLRFLNSTVGTFFGVVVLAGMIDYFELMRRGADWPNATPLILAEISIYRIPQLTEHIMPFAVLVSTMSCYLTLSRRHELVIARAAGISAWQFAAPAVVVAFLFGTVATAAYNPIAALLHEQSKRLEAKMLGESPSSALQESSSGFWVRQKSEDGAAIINAKSSQEQGSSLGGVTVYTFDHDGGFADRFEARNAALERGDWLLDDVRIYSTGKPPRIEKSYKLKTNLTLAQVRESFATPETVPFWQLPSYIDMAEKSGLAAAGYRLQFDELIARPFLLAAMVLLAASVSLRFFRFGGVQKMVLSGICAGFLLFLLQKITDDMSKSELLPPLAAAWVPVMVGGLTGFVVLLYQEDG